MIASSPSLSTERPTSCFSASSPLRAARHILLAVREVHYALDTYRAFLPDKPSFMFGAGADDDFPF
jgi:hypothetical protein